MHKYQLLRNGDSFLRVLAVRDNECLVIDCNKRTMPKWVLKESLDSWVPCDEVDLHISDVSIRSVEEMTSFERKIMHERFTLIAPVLPFVHNESMRSNIITQICDEAKISKATIRKYLCLYLVFRKIEVLAPPSHTTERELSQDEKNFRWALNRFYFTQRKHKLTTVYTLMLKERYTDASGELVHNYPPFHRFRYYYYKTRKQQTELISRNGKSDYQRNNRPLLGSIQDFAPSVGVGMLDSTICDIYLINESGQLVGRPILTLCVDAYSSVIMGYHLSWEGGIYSLQKLMHNVVADKVDWCARHGIVISKVDWNVSCVLPSILVTDKGKEYVGSTFEQLTELGIKMVNLPPYRPELKGVVEHAFALIQGYYKPHLKGKGVIEPDFQERGGHDYRRDACLTISDFEKVILRCILYYNNSRVIGDYVLTQDMLNAGVKPNAISVWNYAYTQEDANLISVDEDTLYMILLPRTEGTFTRRGLIVNKQRYRHCEGSFTERYLKGEKVIVAYNPDDVSSVWLSENGSYTRFELILKIYDNLSLDEVQTFHTQQKLLRADAVHTQQQAMVDLVSSIETIADGCVRHKDVNLKGIRKTRTTEKQKRKLEV